MKRELARHLLHAAALSAVKVFDEGKWYVFAVSFVVLGWITGVNFDASVVLICVIGYGKLMWDGWRSYAEWIEHQKIHLKIPKGMFQMDETHWSIETIGGETLVVEMPPDFDIKRDGPFPLLQEYAPDLMECLGNAQDTQTLKIQIQSKDDVSEG